MADIIYTCGMCGGEGRQNGTVCPDCLGAGSLPLRGMPEILHAIQTEQANLREDLTRALQAIWDKVKDQ
jgi:hypothetical protein